MHAAPRCVLIDGDSDVLSMNARLLRIALPQWEVLPFQNSLEALVYVLDHNADLVVTEFRMREMDGLVLTGHLRSADNGIPVLVTSGYAIAPQALAAGAAAFLPKVEIAAKLEETLVSLGFHAGNRPALQAQGV